MSDRLTYWQRRARDAEHRLKMNEEYYERQYAWMRGLIAEEFRLGRRCEFLYGKAIEHGASHDDLREP